MRARHQLTIAAVVELILRVRTRRPAATSMLFICDHDGRRLGTAGSLLEDRACYQVLGNLHGPDLAVLVGGDHDPFVMTFMVAVSDR